MTDDGYEKIINKYSTVHYGWDRIIKTETINFESGAASCKCCGVIITEEVKRLS